MDLQDELQKRLRILVGEQQDILSMIAGLQARLDEIGHMIAVLEAAKEILPRVDSFLASRKAGEEPLPTIDQMAGSDPDFTGEETTAEYLREIGRTGEER